MTTYYLDFAEGDAVAFRNGVHSKPVHVNNKKAKKAFTILGYRTPGGRSISFYRGDEVVPDGMAAIAVQEKTRRLKSGKIRIYGIGFYKL
jgi:hypothetical protein